MISPGTDAASAPSSPSSTPHSTSRPRTHSSISTLRSWRSASRNAASNSSIVSALPTPTDEPSRAGLTNSGRPSSAVSASNDGRSAAVTVRNRATGRPASRSKRLAVSLSMATADPRMLEPTNGTPASSASPCTEPSSPKGPCSTGKITSTGSPDPTAAPSLDTTSNRPPPPGKRVTSGPSPGTWVGKVSPAKGQSVQAPLRVTAIGTTL